MPWKVILTGEAYFEVTKNSGQPFIVQTENFNVKVLGTSFCINTFGDNGKVYTALESGVVEMDCGRENTLIPGLPDRLPNWMYAAREHVSGCRRYR